MSADENEVDILARAAREDAEVNIPPDEKLRLVSSLVNDLLSLDEEIVKMKQLVELLQKRRENLSTVQIPDALREVRMSGFTLEDGTTVSLKNEVYAGISEKNLPEALGWLRKNGFSDLIKNEIKLSFGMGDDSLSEQVRDYLTNSVKIGFNEKVTVAPQTLRAFVREQDRLGKTVPDTLFSVHRTTETQYKKPKV